MNPIKSIIARKQTRTLENYARSNFAKEMVQYKDLHKGERCFILGNGPSLSPEDLDKLAEKGEVTFAMNRVFKIFPNTKWRPTYYVCEDEIIAQGCLEDMEKVPSKAKFIPLVINYYHNIKVKGATYFHLRYDKALKKEIFSLEGNEEFDALNGIPCMGTVTTTCIFLAVYMGFKEIYLVGIDHNFRITIAEDGSTVTDNSVKDYFCDNYDKDVQDKVTHDLRNTTVSYQMMKEFCDKRKVSVKNATRGGKLEVFPRASLDELLK